MMLVLILTMMMMMVPSSFSCTLSTRYMSNSYSSYLSTVVWSAIGARRRAQKKSRASRAIEQDDQYECLLSKDIYNEPHSALSTLRLKPWLRTDR